MQSDFNENRYDDAYREIKRLHAGFIEGSGVFEIFINLHNIWLFNCRAQKNQGEQFIKVNFNFANLNPFEKEKVATMFILTQKLLSNCSDVQKRFQIV